MYGPTTAKLALKQRSQTDLYLSTHLIQTKSYSRYNISDNHNILPSFSGGRLLQETTKFIGYRGGVGASAISLRAGQAQRAYLGTETDSTIYTAELKDIEIILILAESTLLRYNSEVNLYLLPREPFTKIYIQRIRLIYFLYKIKVAV
ncbi:hypothetical protein BO85DRAFT_439156 [Aspergillus piperis CBS 112811]|uniref:Uncharacterized protein n=1 Tax=Aspergillus piperis CBS 112811 TaxID=1448313 RepID=A0A8G1VLD7_9EURO|nr:hypothetical protein BO85DRAFT_439156 [Aspergillus piperis CBS 112811]RAH56630.1 hypothetical protein BO85DRAFT_439156 [Aspergillus piperis CBS 112811]